MVGASNRDRGFILLAVMVIVGSALLIVTGLLYYAQGETAGQAVGRERAQQSVMVHTALAVIVPRLDRQRDRILSGELPELESQYELFESGGRLAIVRLLPRYPGAPLLEPEAAKLDLNEVDAEQLQAISIFDATTAERIVRFRDETLGRPFQSVVELLHVEGVSPELVYGPLDELEIGHAVEGEGEDGFAAMANSRQPRLGDVIASDVLTVYAFEPALQRDGRRRINLNVEWSDELAGRIDDRFGDGASQIIKGIIDSGVQFDNESVIYAVLNQFDVPVEDWPDIIDTITTEPGEYHFSRLDINTASEEALSALAAIEPETASQIVQVRDGLRGDEAATIAWPAIEGVLEPEQYVQLGERLTARSWTYRVRLAVGTVDADDPTGPMSGALICEAVIDLSAPKPRVAYLRDITMLELAARIAVRDGMVDAEGLDGFDETAAVDTAIDDGPSMDDASIDEPAMGWPDDDWEVGELDPLGEPGMDETDAAGDTSPSGGATRQRIGRWRGG